MKKTEVNKSVLDFVECLLDNQHSLSIRMNGNSMYPALKNSDKGNVEKCNPDELKNGDIIVFRSNGKLIAHRLIKTDKRNNTFISRGDKNTFEDTPFTAEKLIGKITSFERNKKLKRTNSLKMNFLRFCALHIQALTVPFFSLRLSLTSQFATLNSSFKSIKQNFSIVSEKSGKLFFINLIISVLQGIIPFLIIICIKELIDLLTGISSQNEHQNMLFISYLIMTALVFLINGVLTDIRTYFSEKLSQSVTLNIYNRLQTKHSELSLSHYENPDEQDKTHRAVQEASFRPVKIINEILTGIKSVAATFLLAGIFISIRWYLIFLLLIAILPGIGFRLKYSRKLYKLKASQSTKEREMYYYNRVLTGFPFAKELKLFGFFNFFKNRFNTVQNNIFEEKIKLRKSELWYGILAQSFAIILIFISLGYVSYLKINGQITIGTVVLFFFAFQRGYSVLNDLFRSVTQIMEDNTFLNDFIDFLKLPTDKKEEDKENAIFSLTKGIKIENVSFRYETSQRDALKSVNITIPAGKRVAFVGANGSGKTTMVKLLCNFYQPATGKILFDGVDSNLIGRQNICENISAVFQDFALYNITAHENLELGNIKQPVNPEKIRQAAKAAGIDEILESLSKGYETMLGNFFKGGEELSIGQWQKMAIARAFYRDSDLILMDEPSSALDAKSELQIINSLKELSHNKTAVIISHRLSTVQWADLICFFKEGEVIEKGTHAELMDLKGEYYSLFQSSVNRGDKELA